MEIDVKRSRFRDASWFEKIENYEIPVIIGGAGGIGSWLTLLLSRVGKFPIMVYDFDNIEEVNLAGQLYELHQINRGKASAVCEIAQRFSGRWNVSGIDEKYNQNSLVSPIMFSAFDNMKARKDMFENWKKEALANPQTESLFIDGRLLAEQFQVFIVTPERIPLYEKHLFDDKEVPNESCSYKQTSHFAAAIAAKMVQGFTNWFAGDEADIPFKYEEIGSLFFSECKDE